MEHDESMHWADKAAANVIAIRGDKPRYTCASGITPSGTVHIGNFREIITAELVVRGLKRLGKEVRFIYSWDNFDVFRKVPADAPEKELLEKFLRFPITDVPDTYDHKHESYARHNEAEVESTIPIVGIYPEFLYQAQKYRACEYAEEIKTVLEHKAEIKKILDKYRTEDIGKGWMPVSVFCEVCKKDTIKSIEYKEGYELSYRCECGHGESFDFRKKGIAKLPWRIDWPMRWHYEQVDFEPGGKDHSTVGGSRTTAAEIIRAVYGREAPVYMKYDFVTIKGTGGKISKSLGNVVSLGQTLEVYEPAIVRYLFAGTRPDAEFSISFDLDVIKIYEDFDRCERIAFGKEESKEAKKQKRIYELSCVDAMPESMPFQPSFRHLSTVLQTYNFDMKRVHDYYKLENAEDRKRLELRARCCENWLLNYAPEQMKFTVQKEVPAGLELSLDMKKALKEITKLKHGSEEELSSGIYELAKKHGIEPKEFFKSAYKVLINKEQGPKLANFILTIGFSKVEALFSKL